MTVQSPVYLTCRTCLSCSRSYTSGLFCCPRPRKLYVQAPYQLAYLFFFPWTQMEISRRWAIKTKSHAFISGQSTLFLAEGHHWFIFVPSMFILLVLLFFFSCLSVTCWNQGRSGQGLLLLNKTDLSIQRTLSCNLCSSVALAVLKKSELPLARSVFNFFAFSVDTVCLSKP